MIPCCQLKAEVSRKKKKVSTLKHRVTMDGAKPPNNEFVIDLPAEGKLGSSLQFMLCLVSFADPCSHHARFETFGDIAAVAGTCL